MTGVAVINRVARRITGIRHTSGITRSIAGIWAARRITSYSSVGTAIGTATGTTAGTAAGTAIWNTIGAAIWTAIWIMIGVASVLRCPLLFFM